MARTIGIDTGGTFTDLAAARGGKVTVVKVPSTPQDPGAAIVAGIELLGGLRPDDTVVHGTTVALNALLTGRTARVGLVTGAGFRDLVEVGRQERPDIYDLEPVKTAPLVAREHRFEVHSRRWPDPDGAGFVTVEEPTEAELTALSEKLRRARVESVAVCLLHSWADDADERRIEAALAGLGLPVTRSAGILPAHREFERFSTALVNAALAPLMRDYLGSLESRLESKRLFLLQSNGGTLDAARAATEPVRVVLSGPAGGVVGAARAARQAGFARFVALDMGGTSTDVAFHATDGEEAGLVPPAVHVAGHPIGVPSLDIHTIGCGGGSLVRVDEGGILHVGPASAGADPGPVCYGRSRVPTVTDAHVFLGHVGRGRFLAGELELDLDAVARAFETLGRSLGVQPVDAARGVLDVARAAMRRAIGVMTMQRGHDPERLPLVAFGGAGGLQAAALAASLRLEGALVPLHPGALSALGMTAAEALREHARTVLEPLAGWTRTRRRKVAEQLAAAGAAELERAHPGAPGVRHATFLALRYRGQSFELLLTDHDRRGSDVAADFHRTHEALYGHRMERDIELVSIRVRSSLRRARPRGTKPRRRALPAAAQTGMRRVFFARGAALATPLLDRDALPAGCAFAGPALVEEYSGTTLVPPGWKASVTAGGHLWLTADAAQK